MSKMTIELTPDELKDIIAKHVDSSLDFVRNSVNPADIDFVITQEWQGYGSNEQQVSVFKGAKFTTTS